MFFYHQVKLLISALFRTLKLTYGGQKLARNGRWQEGFYQIIQALIHFCAIKYIYFLIYPGRNTKCSSFQWVRHHSDLQLSVKILCSAFLTARSAFCSFPIIFASISSTDTHTHTFLPLKVCACGREREGNREGRVVERVLAASFDLKQMEGRGGREKE